MDFKNILNEIEKVDPEVFERLSPRRHILKSFGSKVAVAALPFALGSLLQKAYGKDTKKTDVAGVLNYALTLELLEYNFYYEALNGSTAIVPSGDTDNIAEILNHEMEHVNFLRTALTSAGAAIAPSLNHYPGTSSSNLALNPESFNFPNVNLGGSTVNVYANYDTFLAFAQVFEDTGVRAYKGAAPQLQGTTVSNSTTNPVLTAALQIHSVEARHASHIRSIRRKRSAAPASGAIKPWITGNNTYITAVNVSGNYGAGNPSSTFPAENNTTQGGVSITSLAGASGNVSANAATEAFDEPLDMGTVVTLVTPFIAS